MKYLLASLTIALATAALAWQHDVRLPNGKSQQQEILKADHERSVEDAARLLELTESLKEELEKNERHVVSVSSIKKTEEIEKLARRIRGRLQRH
jgi:hypothetical protein